jgi:small-conductance mechanosensitive channel
MVPRIIGLIAILALALVTSLNQLTPSMTDTEIYRHLIVIVAMSVPATVAIAACVGYEYLRSYERIAYRRTPAGKMTT